MIELIISSLSLILDQWKGLVHPLVLANQGNRSAPPSLFNLIMTHNLNHVSVFPLTLRLSCLLLCLPALAYPSHHHYPSTCVGLSTFSADSGQSSVVRRTTHGTSYVVRRTVLCIMIMMNDVLLFLLLSYNIYNDIVCICQDYTNTVRGTKHTRH